MSIFENIALNMNIANNASGSEKGPGNINNAKNTVLRDMAMKLLEALEVGDSEMTLELKAEVRDIMQNQLFLTLPDQSVISGRTDTLLPLSIGDNATFKASLSPEGQLTLSLVSSDSSDTGNDSRITSDNPLVKKALTSANIPINQRSMLVTSELLNAGQAVNTTNIRKFISLSFKHPDIPIKELVLLDANKVPMTPENLQAFSELAKGAAVWEASPSVDQNTALPQPQTERLQQPEQQIIISTPEANVAQEAEKEASQATATTATTIPEANVAQEDKKEASQATATTATTIPEANVAQEGEKEASQATASTTTTIPEANVAQEDKKEASQATATPEVSPKDSPKVAHKEKQVPNGIEPKDFSEESVKKFYNALKSNTPSTSEKSVEEAVERTAQNTSQATTSDKLQFMQDINNVFPFIQIPVKLREENAKGELYVFEKKKHYNPDEPLTAVLHLELESLGNTDIKVTLFKNKVNALFEVSDETAMTFFKDELPELSKRLDKLGFTFDTDFKVKVPASEEKPLLYQFLEAHSPKSYSRYTFDVHA